MAVTPTFFDFGEILNIDLATEHIDHPIEVVAVVLAVLFCDGSASLKFNSKEGASFNMLRIGTMNFGKHPVKRLYLSNAAQAGKTAQILVTELEDITIQSAPIAGSAILVTAAAVKYDARQADQDVTEIENEAIRDTAAHTSDIIAAGAHRTFTFIFANGCNEIVSIQLQGSHDGATFINIGDPTSVAATSSEYQTLTEAWHSFRCVSTAASSPASGSLLIEAIRRS